MKEDLPGPQHVLSLGTRCFVARSLELMHWRRYAGPFDWIYSSAQMVRHCIEDDFVSFLDATELEKAGHAWAHRSYARMLGRQVVFPHHYPLDRDREHFQRAVRRCRQVLLSEERKLFVFMHLVTSRKELANVRDVESSHGSNLREVQELFQTLQSKVAKFHLLVVYVIQGASKWSRGASELSCRQPVHITSSESSMQKLNIFEVHCQGSCTGLKFKEPHDQMLLQTLLRSAGGPLDPAADPLPDRFHMQSQRRKTRICFNLEAASAAQMGTKTVHSPQRRKRRRKVTVTKVAGVGGQKRKADVEDAKREDDDVVIVSVSTTVKPGVTSVTSGAPEVRAAPVGKPRGVLDIRVALRSLHSVPGVTRTESQPQRVTAAGKTKFPPYLRLQSPCKGHRHLACKGASVPLLFFVQFYPKTTPNFGQQRQKHHRFSFVGFSMAL